MDRLTMQAAMSGNLEAQRRFFGASVKKSSVLQENVIAPIVMPKPCLPTALQAMMDVDKEIDEVEFDRRMRSATQKEFAKTK